MGDGVPVRLRLSRKKGFDLQAHSRATNGLEAVAVCRPTKWGNPHRWQECPADIGSAEWARGAAVEAYEEDLLRGRLRVSCDEVASELSGVNVACWCKAEWSCHADVLLKTARRLQANSALARTTGADDGL